MQLVGIARLGPDFVAHLLNCARVELAEVGSTLGVHPAPRQHRLGAALFERRVVEEGVRSRAQDFEREWRRLGGVARDHFDRTTRQIGEQRFQAVDVHRVVQAVGYGLPHERVVRNFAVADDVFAAGELVRENRAEQIFRGHALQLRRGLLATAHARQRECHRAVPAPARAEHRRGKQRLHEQRPHGLRRQVACHLVERETVRRRKRQDDRVFRRRSLQLEVELAAKALAQRQAPGAVDAAAQRRVDHELHAARFIEEALEDDSLQRRQRAQRRLRGSKVVGDLLGGRARQRQRAAGGHQPVQCRVTPAGIEPGRDVLAQTRH